MEQFFDRGFARAPRATRRGEAVRTRGGEPGPSPPERRWKRRCFALQSCQRPRQSWRGGRCEAQPPKPKLARLFCGPSLGELFAQPVHQTLDPVSLFIIDPDELDPHSRDLLTGVVDLIDSGDSPDEVERKRGIG